MCGNCSGCSEALPGKTDAGSLASSDEAQPAWWHVGTAGSQGGRQQHGGAVGGSCELGPNMAISCLCDPKPRFPYLWKVE